ncbi:MAG: hypothetical protein GY884_25315, partial [Proteobacteria bacterium]|nr:hypothetical protein [Pseudomonadota bacterium]
MMLFALLACQTDDANPSGGEGADDTSISAGADDSGPADTDDAGSGGDWAGVEDLDGWITEIAGQVDEARLTADIQTLQDFGTRSTGTLGNEQAVDWIEGELQALGLEVERDAFTFSASGSLNLVARQDGVSDRVWIFSA